MNPITPETAIQRVMAACADCDVCRDLMAEACLFFPELYRLHDREARGGKRASSAELQNLVDRCTFCALCPCPNVRSDILAAKTGFVERDGLSWRLRALANVGGTARLCGIFPRLSNRLLQNAAISTAVKATLGIHPQRRLPLVPQRSFDAWFAARPLRPPETARRKVVYFVGCSGRYLFPSVPQAAVRLMESLGVDVQVPQQACCGMPSLLEGDRERTLRMVRTNLETLQAAVNAGRDILCACPTCSYFLKTLLTTGAYFSPQYQEMIGARPDELRVPTGSPSSTDEALSFFSLDKAIYRNILKADGYFAGIDPLLRIRVAQRVFDVGQYLRQLQGEGAFQAVPRKIEGFCVYYPPCHLREQEIGHPYLEMLRAVPGLRIDSVDWSLYCCGMGGIMGLKQTFHNASLGIGRRLFERIEALRPQRIVTDCLSCRLQFQQALPYPVVHPVELLAEAWCPSGRCAHERLPPTTHRGRRAAPESAKKSFHRSS